MSPSPLVSVVVPAYNSERTILHTLRTILHQTCSSLEVIVVDDGSCDSTAQSVLSIEDSRANLIRSGHLGVSAARNLGIATALGQFVLLLDADDLIPARHIELLLEPLMNDATVDVCYSDVTYAYELDDGLELGTTLSLAHARDQLRRQLMCGASMTPGAKLYRARSLATIGGFNPLLRFNEDLEHDLRAAKDLRWEPVKGTSVLYRKRKSSSSGNMPSYLNRRGSVRRVHAMQTEGERYWRRELLVSDLAAKHGAARIVREELGAALAKRRKGEDNWVRDPATRIPPRMMLSLMPLLLPGVHQVTGAIQRLLLFRLTGASSVWRTHEALKGTRIRANDAPLCQG